MNDRLHLDEETIRGAPFLAGAEFHEQLDSTNDHALRLLAQQTPPTLPYLVVARQQTGGRGRGANRWWSAPGALTCTVLVASGRGALHRPPPLSLLTGLAVRRVVAELLPGRRVSLKWPNDIYVQQQKICGILVESPPHRPGEFVLGIGLNVNNRLASAPAELSASATSLTDVLGETVDGTHVLLQLLDRLQTELGEGRTAKSSLPERWRPHCFLEGRTVSLAVGSEEIVGVCQGINDEGALLVRTEHGPRECYAGVVRAVL